MQLTITSRTSDFRFFFNSIDAYGVVDTSVIFKVVRETQEIECQYVEGGWEWSHIVRDVMSKVFPFIITYHVLCLVQESVALLSKIRSQLIFDVDFFFFHMYSNTSSSLSKFSPLTLTRHYAKENCSSLMFEDNLTSITTLCDNVRTSYFFIYDTVLRSKQYWERFRKTTNPCIMTNIVFHDVKNLNVSTSRDIT